MARKKIIAGNWKMNKTPSEAVELVNLLKDLVKNDDVDVVYCVPAIDIVPVVEATKGTNVAVGAENMYFEESGAYTGEISAAMLVDAGVKYVIIGHSERRDYFKEVCKGIRDLIAEIYDTDTAEAVRIQYGGSMNAGNAAELLAKPDIDGGLIGGASLKADFGQVVNAGK